MLQPTKRRKSYDWAVLGLVYAFLPQRFVLRRCRAVCARWANTPAEWAHVTLRSSDEAAAVLRGCVRAKIKSVTLCGVDLTTFLRIWGTCALERLEIGDGTHVTRDELTVLHAFTDLTKISFDTKVEETTLAQISGVPNLREVTLLNAVGQSLCELQTTSSLASVNVTNATVPNSLLSLFSPQLRKLRLDRCFVTRADAFSGLARCVNLEHLHVYGTLQIPILRPILQEIQNLARLSTLGLCSSDWFGTEADDVKALLTLPMLTDLDLRFTSVTDAALLVLKALPLRTVKVAGCNHVTKAGFLHLATMPSLRSCSTSRFVSDLGPGSSLHTLRVSRSSLASVRDFVAFPLLTNLFLVACPLTQHTLAIIGRVLSLKQLGLSHSYFQDFDLSCLRDLKLSHLNISFWELSAEDVADLCRIATLTNLYAQGCRLTNASVESFRHLPFLELLDLGQNPKLSEPCKQALRADIECVKFTTIL
jgi:hypothetical protein